MVENVARTRAITVVLTVAKKGVITLTLTKVIPVALRVVYL